MAQGYSLFMLSLLLLSVLVGAFASGYGSSQNPNTETSKNLKKLQEYYPRVFSVKGVIYCKSASGVRSLKGGVIRITCLGIDKDGYETAPFSVLSRPADANGYFLTRLSSQLLEDEDVKITQCKAFLHSSPLKTCPFATDFNRGLSGALLSAYRPLGSGNMRLYSVGPFIYSSGPPQSTPHY